MRHFLDYPVGIACLLCVAACSGDDEGQPPGSGFGASSGTGGGIIVPGVGGGDSGQGSDALEDGCGHSPFDKTIKPVNILLAIDRSDSMKLTPPGFATTKWAAMKSALSVALDQVKGALNLGLVLFPAGTALADGGADSCAMGADAATALQVPVGPGVTTVPTILTAFDAPPSGSTPTAVALSRALQYFTTGAGKDLTGDKFVLLATDGGPNCNEAAPACTEALCTTNVDGLCVPNVNCCDGYVKGCLDTAGTTTALGALKTAGVKTIVVGIPGSELYQTQLDQFADAGGMPASTTSPKYYKVDADADAGDGVARLTAAFTKITSQLITTCRLQLASQPPDLGLLNVTVDGQFVPVSPVEGGADGGADGWHLDVTTTPATVVLDGALCRKVESEGVSSIQVEYGCPTVKVN